MPFPAIPDSEFKGRVFVGEVECYYYIYNEYNTIIHIYVAVKDKSPVRLIQESFENGLSTPMLTYDFHNVTMGPPDSAVFEIPVPFSHFTCERHIGGFPYLHIFHHFVRF